MTKSLISENIVSALHEQWVHERENAHIYLYIAGFLINKGLDNIAKHFSGQHEEEIGHSQIIFDLLTDLNAPIELLDVSKVSVSTNSILDISKAYLDREVSTTESLESIKQLAIEENNPVVEEKIRYMISLQQNEYEEATTFNDRAELTGGDWFKVFLWDIAIEKG